MVAFASRFHQDKSRIQSQDRHVNVAVDQEELKYILSPFKRWI